jgi:hypothetical protein
VRNAPGQTSDPGNAGQASLESLVKSLALHDRSPLDPDLEGFILIELRGVHVVEASQVRRAI